MISTLSVQNIALIEKLEVELGRGLNILSGETGAGKSIIIDSLNFVLGERADRSLIRYGSDFAIVEAVFSDYQTKSISDYLDEIGVEAEEILILRRKMSLDGKNECRINGKTATLSILKGLTELLVDIHGQHEHQSLLKVANHILLLDSMGGEKTREAISCVSEEYNKYNSLKKELARYGNDEERARKLDILTFQIEEIEKADVKEGEENDLLDKRKRIRNMEKILSALSSAQNTLDGGGGASVTASLKLSAASLNSVSTFDERIASLIDRLDAAKVEVADVSDTVAEMLRELNFDSNTADGIEERLEKVRTIQRKYGGSYENLQIFYNNAKTEADTLANAGDMTAKLAKQIKGSAEQLVIKASKLTSLRRKSAEDFKKNMLRELADLGMGGSTFEVQLTSVDDPDQISASGADSVEFMISPNIGEPLKPLAKIISGGEMSRFMLALKNITASLDEIGTMVFDEIDTGISGHISAVVAEKMCNISRNRQVIAVTHMPSLAAMADTHFLIKKSVENGKTLTHLDLLADDTDEIARLIGGNEYSLHALPHAKEMKAWGERYKKDILK